MKPLTLSLVLLCFAFLTINMTCNDGSLPDNNTETISCIDKDKINPKQPCPRNYAPVCGCNDQTYNNICEAEKAGVTKWTDGKCDDCIDKSKIDPSKPCTKEYVPVCGCDGRTYSNKCMAEKAGLRKWEPGKCADNKGNNGCIDQSKIDPDALCMQVYEPVCGCDKNTYGNKCEAVRAGVIKWVDGPCEQDSDCIDKTKIKTKDCTDEYAPVCGCNGRTYPNACSAEVSGVTKWVDGKCK